MLSCIGKSFKMFYLFKVLLIYRVFLFSFQWKKSWTNFDEKLTKKVASLILFLKALNYWYVFVCIHLWFVCMFYREDVNIKPLILIDLITKPSTLEYIWSFEHVTSRRYSFHFKIRSICDHVYDSSQNVLNQTESVWFRKKKWNIFS